MALYRELIAWQKAIDLAERVYLVTARFPQDEKFGLISQMRRAAVSVPSNIAEGHGRGSPAEFQRFLRIALGSVREVETQLILAGRFHFAEREHLIAVLRDAEEMAKILNGLLRSSLATRNS